MALDRSLSAGSDNCEERFAVPGLSSGSAAIMCFPGLAWTDHRQFDLTYLLLSLQTASAISAHTLFFATQVLASISGMHDGRKLKESFASAHARVYAK